MICVEPHSLEPVWRQPGFADGAFIIADGLILALNGRSGDLILARATPDSYQELGRSQAPLGGRSWTAPVLSEGRLLIRNPTTLGCLDLRLAQASARQGTDTPKAAMP